MKLICNFICKFDVDHLLYAINSKHLDESVILSLKYDVEEHHVKLQRQRDLYLEPFCKKHPKDFTNEGNGEADTTSKLTWRMRSGAAGVKKALKRFSKKSHKPLPPGVTERQAHEVSLINQPNYYSDLYGLSSYPQCVKDLFLVMFEFYQTVESCCEMSIDCLKEVEHTRSDARRCLALLKNALEQSEQHQRTLIAAMMSDEELRKVVVKNKTLYGDESNPVLKDYKRSAGNMEEFAQRRYKNCTRGDVVNITLRSALAEAEEKPVEAFAAIVFGNDHEHIRRVNCVIEHFDELLPEKCKRSKIPAASLYYFYLWSQSTKGMSTFLSYFNRRYLKCGGKWETIGKSALTGAQKKYSPSGASGKEKRKMDYKIEKLLSARLPKIEKAS